jgi:hypothetical protein
MMLNFIVYFALGPGVRDASAKLPEAWPAF